MESRACARNREQIIFEGILTLFLSNSRVYHPASDGRSITLYHVGQDESCILTASCIINGAAFPAIAETETEARGYAIPATSVQEWMQSEPQWQHYLFGLLAERMASLIELVDALAFRRLDNRLAEWLLLQSELANAPQIKTTHQLIADDLVSSREVISRLLKEFEREQLISLGRGDIKIIEIKKLQSIASENK